MIKLKFHGHSCWEISGNGHDLVIDPFLTNNPLAKAKPDDIKARWIIISHGHDDHWGDTPAIARKNDATVITNFELSNYAGSKGLNTHPLHIGGGHDFPFGRVKLTIAHHGSTLEAEDYGGNPAGILLTIDGKTIYHAGDTGLFMDMKLIGEMNKIDLALLPIGDNFTMGPEDAAKAVEFLKPKTVIPMHYNTFDVIEQDPKKFKEMVEKQGFNCEIVEPGGTFELS